MADEPAAGTTATVEAPQSAPVEVAAPAAPAESTPATGEDGLGDAGKKALDRMKAERDEARRQAKAHADAAKRLQEIEDAQKTAEQRNAESLSSAQRDLEQARAESARLRIGVRHGLTEDDLDLLGSGSDEEIESRAKRVAELKQAAATAGAAVTATGPSPRRPAEELRAGASATPAPPPVSPGMARLRQAYGAK